MLAVMDFDNTIINENSDAAIIGLIGREQIPKEIKELHKKTGWTAFMGGIFHLLSEVGIGEADILSLIENLAPVQGIFELITFLKDHKYDIIILSDSNTYFIDAWLKRNKLTNSFLRVYTNPAHFADGFLHITGYQFQTNCKLSDQNLCKGQVLEEFLAEQKSKGVNYAKIVYCGDGINDFCPILRLNKTDLACVRNNYECLNLVLKAQNGHSFDHTGRPHDIKAEILAWDNAIEILKRLETF